MLMGLESFDEHRLRNVDEADIDLEGIGELKDEPEEAQRESLADNDLDSLLERFRDGAGVSACRRCAPARCWWTAPARLVSVEGAQERNLFRINRLLDPRSMSCRCARWS